jgi:hypothetical protein
MIVIEFTQHDGREEIYQKDLLSAKISKAMITGDDITLRSYEGWSHRENGLFNMVDNLCKFWQYDKNKITIETNAWGETHPNYNVIEAKYHSDFLNFNTPCTKIEWNQNFIFGMFIGIARRERMYSLWRYRQSMYKELGLTSFNQDFMDIDISADMAKVCHYADCKVNDIISIRPYSDIDQIRKPPIWLDLNTVGPLWEQAYEQIALEVVCESNSASDVFILSEKILRPMYYRRPFLVVGSKDYLKNLRKLGFRTFDDVIPNYYDQFEEFIRVDSVFQILESLIESNAIELILDQCQSDIEHNYNLVLELSNKHLQIKKDNPGYFKHD